MAFEFLIPLDETLVDFAQQCKEQSIGRRIQLHTAQIGMPELDTIKVVVFGVSETRNAEEGFDRTSFDGVRKAFYTLYPGNWDVPLADIGDVLPGATVEDTYFVVRNLVEILLKSSIIPIILGGSQDLVYPLYRAYDNFDQMVNLVNVDNRFDLGDTAKKITNHSFVGKIVVDKPYNLFNYSNLGYQTYFNSQEEIDLMEKLYFDAYRLGELSSDIGIAEPVLRDADIVCVDLDVVSSGVLGSEGKYPNGLDGKEVCAIARYAGISDRVSSFGIFELFKVDKEGLSTMLVAQIMWYFIEGFNYRSGELLVKNQSNVLHYTVPVEDEILSFYKSLKTERWWIEIPFGTSANNKLKRHTLLPCDYKDYENACNQEIPKRWFMAKRKNEV